MDITKDTKMTDILAAYPRLKEKLTEISPKFKMLGTPMGKVMLGKATVADMSEKSGVDIDKLIRKPEIIRSSISPSQRIRTSVRRSIHITNFSSHVTAAWRFMEWKVIQSGWMRENVYSPPRIRPWE